MVLLAGVLGALAPVAFVKWRDATKRGGQQPAEPFRVAGNLYYVGANDVTSFLLTGPEGHVLIDGGYPGTPPLIMASIAKLGFDIRDVKVLLNSEPHYDHAGGLAALQKASDAELWASEASADTLASGGEDDASATFLPMKIFVWVGLISYPPARVDHRFKDGATIRLGTTTLTAHITGGHTRGCTSWSFPVVTGGSRASRNSPQCLHLTAVHMLVSRGGWTAAGEWIPVPYVDEGAGEKLFRHKVLAFLRRRELLSQERIDLLLSWRRSGFSVHNPGVCGRRGLPRFGCLVRYMMRPPVSLSRLRFTAGSKRGRLHGQGRAWRNRAG